jgi:hypothetical protein
LFAGNGLDGGDQRPQTGGAPREAAGQCDEQSVVVTSGGAVLGSDPREVADVLPEHDVSAGDCGAEHLRISRARESKICNGGRFDPSSPKRFGDGRRVHLVDEDVHRASATSQDDGCTARYTIRFRPEGD